MMSIATEEPAAIEPDLAIIDSHHHLWANAKGAYQTQAAFDAQFAVGGHKVVASVYVECGAMNRIEGPVALRTAGEAAFVAEVAEGYARSGRPGLCAGFVGEADLREGDAVEDVLEALDIASEGRLRGIRGTALWDADAGVNSGTRPFAPRHLLGRDDFRAGSGVWSPGGSSTTPGSISIS